MRHTTWIVGAMLLLAGVCTGADVSPQGVLVGGPPQGSGAFRWHVVVEEGHAQPFHAVVVVTDERGTVHRVAAEGEAFLVSSLGLVVAFRQPDTPALAATIDVSDLDGNRVWSRQVRGLANPVLSRYGRTLAFLTSDALSAVDLKTFVATPHPRLLPFAVSDDGSVAGLHIDGDGPDGFEFAVLRPDQPELRVSLADRPRDIAFDQDGRSVLVLARSELLRVEGDGSVTSVLEATPGWDFRDLVVDGDAITVGMRRRDGRTYHGASLELDRNGNILRAESGPSRVEPDPTGVRGARGIPWPLAPDEQHEVGNTYGEYQNYGGAPYLHPGVDVMGTAGQPVYAVAGGVVKAVLTTSGQWHWRLATADSATSGTSKGYLYAHLDQPTITVGVGDTVVQGQHLGDLVAWPVAGFHHVHFARIEDSGVQWTGSWDSIDNPHIDFNVHGETEAPVFEPAIGSDLLAFCTNQTASYLDPNALSGEIDIVAHVGDRVVSNWVCSAQSIRYTIYPVGYPESPVVDDKLAVNFDMLLDTYYGGPIDPFLVGLFYKQDATCRTQGDYDYREFYHIITNSDGNEVYETSDLAEAWDTTQLPDADYVVRVTAVDAAGNAASDSMTVTTANGNPTWVPAAHGTRLSLEGPFPNPSTHGTAIAFFVPTDAKVTLAVYSPAGRRVRTLVSGRLPAGPHEIDWDLRDSIGAEVASGIYLARLESRGEAVTRKLAVMR